MSKDKTKTHIETLPYGKNKYGGYITRVLNIDGLGNVYFYDEDHRYCYWRAEDEGKAFKFCAPEVYTEEIAVMVRGEKKVYKRRVNDIVEVEGFDMEVGVFKLNGENAYCARPANSGAMWFEVSGILVKERNKEFGI